MRQVSQPPLFGGYNDKDDDKDDDKYKRKLQKYIVKNYA
jgi:hypothetical protein